MSTSDGPDSTTSGSDIPEGHADRPPEVEYSERLTSANRQDEGGTERLCSPNMKMAVIQLQRDVDECRTELELARKQTPAVTLRPQRWSGLTSTPVPRYSGKSNWEQYREVFEAIVCSNGWDDVTAALQLLSHLNVALLVPESRRVVTGFLIKSLSDQYNALGHLAEYKRQFQRAFRRPGDDPSIFATELEMLARRAFMDIDTKIQLQMVRDRFIDGQAECARSVHRHLDSLGPNTPMTDIVDCCRVWERHCEVEIQPRTSADRRPVRVICQVTEVEPAPATSPETETVQDLIRKLLPTPALPSPQAVPIPSDRDVLIQQLMEAICPPTPVAQERSVATDLETLLLNWLPVGTVTEEDAASPDSLSDSAEGCFSCGGLTHATDQCQTLESFPFLPMGWQAEHRRPVHPGTGSSSEAPGPADGKRRLIRGEGLVARISNDYRPQLPVVGKDITGPATPCYVGTARLLETGNNRTRSDGRAVRHPCSDSEESDNDVVYAEEHDSTVQQVSRRKDWLTQTANNSW